MVPGIQFNSRCIFILISLLAETASSSHYKYGYRRYKSKKVSNHCQFKLDLDARFLKETDDIVFFKDTTSCFMRNGDTFKIRDNACEGQGALLVNGNAETPAGNDDIRVKCDRNWLKARGFEPDPRKFIEIQSMECGTFRITLVDDRFLGTIELDWKDPIDAPAGSNPLRVPDDDLDSTGEPITGLSGITSSSAGNIFWAISDNKKYPRYYRMTMEINNDGYVDDNVEFTDVEYLRDSFGNRLPEDYVDPEGITLRTDNEQFFYWANEECRTTGGPLGLIEGDPSVHEATVVGGWHTRTFNNPIAFQGNGGTRGIRRSNGYQAIAVTPNGKRLIAIPQSPLIQDRFQTDTQTGLVRFPVWDGTTGSLDPIHVYIYPSGPTPEGLETIVDGAVALDNSRFLVLENVENPDTSAMLELNIYEIDLTGATDILGETAIPDNAVPVEKKLIGSCKGPCSPSLPLQSYQGAAFGPTNADGSRSLVVVSEGDETHFLLFRLRTV